MSCKTRRSISTMQVDVAEWCKYMNILQRSRKVCCLFLCSFGLDGFARFLSCWLCTALRAPGLRGFVCVHLFAATKATIVRKAHTRPTPKQRPQHQHLLVCSSSYTTANNNHKSNSNHSNNNNNNNNKKLLLQLQLAASTKTTATTTASTATRITKQTRAHNQQPTTSDQQQLANIMWCNWQAN